MTDLPAERRYKGALERISNYPATIYDTAGDLHAIRGIAHEALQEPVVEVEVSKAEAECPKCHNTTVIFRGGGWGNAISCAQCGQRMLPTIPA